MYKRQVQDPAGLWDEDTFRIVVAEFYDTIAEARNNPDGTWVRLTGKLMTAAFADEIYVEEPNRSAGIRLVNPPAAAAGYAEAAEETWAVDFAGPLGTSYAEREIALYYGEVTAIADLPEPLGMPNRALGGGSPNAYTEAVPLGGIGLYNVGLLVRTTGKVVRHSGGYFYIDDGSPIIDAWTQPCVIVDDDGLGGWVPPLGSYVTVTGIIGANTLDGDPIRILRPRSQDDVVVTRLNAAYIYYDNPTDAQDFESRLETYGVPTDLVYIKNLGSTDLSPYQVILIGNDTPWGSPSDVTAVLNANTPVIAIGYGGAVFLDEVPGLYIGRLNSWSAAGQTHATVVGGEIYQYPYEIPYSPGQNVYLYYSSGVWAESVYDPTGVTYQMLREFGDDNHYVLAGEQDRFYQWGFYGAPAAMTGWGEKVFVNLIYRSVRP